MGKLMDSLPNWVCEKALVNIKPEYRWLYEKVGTELIQTQYQFVNSPMRHLR